MGSGAKAAASVRRDTHIPIHYISFTSLHTNSGKGSISKRIATIRSPQVQAKLYKTEYRDAYKSRPWQAPQKAMKPTVIRGVSTLSYPVEMVSCTHRSFVPHTPRRKPRSYKPKHDEYARPDVKMNTTTTYTTEFHEKGAASRPSPFKPQDMKHRATKPFNAKTIYQAHFIEFSPAEKEACKVEIMPHGDNLGKEDKPAFSAQSTAQDSFRPPGHVCPATSLKPEETSHIDHTKPFQTETTHRADFTPKTLPFAEVSITKEPVTPRTLPNKSREPARGDCGYLTVFKGDYVEHEGGSPASTYKPKQKYRENLTKFDGRTTHRMSYQPIPIPASKPRPSRADRGRGAAVSKAKCARRDLITSYQDAFMDPSRIFPMEKCRGVIYKATCNASGSGGRGSGDDRTPMEINTQYRLSFVPWEKITRSESYKVCTSYKPPTAPFFGKSTSMAHYKGIPAPPAKLCKPLVKTRSSLGIVSSLTTYRATFGRRATSCPPPIEKKSSTQKVATQVPLTPPNTPMKTPASASSNQI